MEKKLDNKKIGQLFINLRKNHKYQLNEFAEILGVNPRKMKKIEAGEELPNLSIVIKSCHLFDICADDFIIYLE